MSPMNASQEADAWAASSGGAAPAFSPLDISGLALWLDASDSTTLFQDDAGTTPAAANDDPVGYWGDKSGNGNNVTQAGATARPLLKTAVQNGRNGVLFDNSNDSMGNTLAMPDVSTMLVAYNVLGTPGSDTVFSTTSVNFLAQRFNSGTTIQSWPNGAASVMVLTTTYSNAAAVLQLANDYTADQYIIQYNGDTLANTTARVNPGGTILIGAAGPTASTELLNGHVFELCLFSRTLTDAERATVRSYLVAKWGIV